MTKKYREIFFIILCSNVCTIIFMVIVWGIYDEQLFVDHNEASIINFDSIIGIINCVLCIIVVWKLCSFLKAHNNTEIVINNHVTSVQSVLYTKEKLEDIRKKHRQISEKKRTDRMKAVIEYTNNILSPYLTNENLDILCQNIKHFDAPGSCLKAITTNQTLSSIDIKHYGWNIGERLGWSGQQRANFIKLCFPKELSGIEIESLRRTFRKRGKCIIEIDIPDNNEFEFH